MAASAGVMAQKEGFGYKFYGQVRTDLFYNSRSNSETVDGLFYMYPKDVAPDADGKDLNAKPDGNFYTLYTRLGVDVTGPILGKAKTSAKVEVDFRGSGTLILCSVFVTCISTLIGENQPCWLDKHGILCMEM